MNGARAMPTSNAPGVPRAGVARPGAGARQRARRAVALASGLLFVAFGPALAISFAVTPEAIEAGRVVLSPTCHFKATFGRECPTCGLTRAFCALSHGRLADARRYNRAAPALYALWWAGAGVALATLGRALFAKNEKGTMAP